MVRTAVVEDPKNSNRGKFLEPVENGDFRAKKCPFAGSFVVRLQLEESGDFELDNEPRRKPHQKFEDAEQQALLDEDSTQTQEKLAKQLQVSQGAVSLRLNSLRMTQKLFRWVPHELSERQQERRLVTCEGLLARHEKKSFLHRIVTSDEKSIHFSNPMRQRSWGLLGQFPKQKPRPNRLGKKAMLCVCRTNPDVDGRITSTMEDKLSPNTFRRYRDLVRDSRSPWAFPVTLVPKADNQKRLCVDYRHLNALTIDDKMPLPNIQEVIDRLQGAKYFTSLDIASEVLEKLYSQNLKLKLQKCSFIREEIEYLGYIIKYNQVTPSPRKIVAIKSFPIPKTVKNIQKFNGLCSYYRRLIKDFSSIAQPLKDLLNKDKIFHWSEIHQRAFETLKNLITQPPVLAMYDPTLPSKLYTDASEQGLGAILAQKHPDGRERVVSYFPKRLNPTQSRYTATELECFSIIEAVRHFNNYLDKPFQIVNDHSALKWLLNHKNPGGRLFRWSMELFSRSFTIIHRAGGQQTHVDALSRNPVCTFITEDKIKIAQQQADLRFVKNPQIKSGIVTI
ncbi:K02A2.6-like [Cordylochernes scorpioides]|uniref:K02A2.6-like n=1 Tax=Cordylochernes scorpioides TaxID=51811 RepID=A0ABY6K933_9ARAC|nr:K02A2.6-like [Cordylochernes scorpioides]